MESATAAEQPAPLRTRFGRTVRAPTRYEPVEVPLDDDSELEFSECSSEEDTSPSKKRRRYQLESEDDESDDESDVGSLKDFVVSDGEVEDTDSEDEAEEEDLFDSEADSETEAE